jgi:transposase
VLQAADVPTPSGCDQASPEALAGDLAYRAERIDSWLIDRDILPVVPQKGDKANDDDHPGFDRQLYRRRNIIERLIGWLKECRRVFSRFEKTAINYAGMLKLAIIQRYLRLICP